MKQRSLVLAFLILLAMITYLDRLCISVLGPRMQSDLGLSPEDWGWVVGAFTFAYGAFEIPGGALGDQYGHRRILTRIVIWWSLFTVFTGCVSNFGMLLLVRFLFGAGEAGAFPNISGCASRWFDSVGRARAQGFIWGSSRFGAILAHVLVGVVLFVFNDWRPAFWIFGSLGLIWAALWYGWYRDPRIGQTTGGRAKENAPHIVAEVQRTIPWKKLFSSRKIWLIMVTYSFYVWGSTFYLTWLHTYLVKGRGLQESEMTTLSMLPFVLGMFANPLGGALSDALSLRLGLKLGRRIVGCSGMVLAAVCLLLTCGTTGKWNAILFLSLGFFFLDLANPSAWAVCMDVGGKYSGAVSGAMNSFGHVGGTICSISFGYCVKRCGSYEVPLMMIAVMLSVASALFSRIDSSQPLISDEEVSSETSVEESRQLDD